jgi:NTE family protein
MRQRLLVLVLWLLALIGPVRVAAQGASPPRIGLALSGGSARGLAHIGVLQVLEELGITVDAVAGTSMGAVIGGLYAAGYGPDSLAGIVRQLDWGRLLSDRMDRGYLLPEQKVADERHAVTVPTRGFPPQPGARLVGGHNVRQALARVTWPVATVRDFRRLPIPFAAVATDLETGEAVVFTRGVLADALAASMAIPAVLPPVHLDGRLLVDGMLVRNLPARDVRALGADVLVCADVSAPLKEAEELRTVAGVVSQTVSLLIAQALEQERARCDILIAPDIEGLGSLDFGAADEWIERGRRAALAVRGRLEALGARQAGAVAAARHRGPATHAVRVDSIVVPDLAPLRGRALARRMHLAVPGPLGPADVQRGMDRLFATGAFDRVSYHLEPTGAGDESTVLVVRTADPGTQTIGLGVRYETQYKASLLLTATAFERFGSNSIARLDLRLGEQLRVGGDYQRRFGGVVPWSLGVHAGYDRVPFDVYEAAQRVAAGQFHVLGGGVFLGAVAGSAVLTGVDLKAEHVTQEPIVAAGDSLAEDSRGVWAAGVSLFADTRDHRSFERRGVVLRAHAEWGGSTGASGGFTQYSARARAALPLTPFLSLLARAELGASSGDGLPSHYLFLMGGANEYHLLTDRHVPFLGLRVQERRGQYLQIAGVGAQVHFPSRFAALARWNAGWVGDDWAPSTGALTTGLGLTLVARAGSGTAALSVARLADGGPYRVEVDAGFAF